MSADIGTAGFAGLWEPAVLATLTRRLMKRPTAQHSGTHMERHHLKRENWCLFL